MELGLAFEGGGHDAVADALMLLKIWAWLEAHPLTNFLSKVDEREGAENHATQTTELKVASYKRISASSFRISLSRLMQLVFRLNWPSCEANVIYKRNLTLIRIYGGLTRV